MEWKWWVLAEKWVSSNSPSFGQHALNPFDTKPMAKIAVKMSIMRVVKFMSSEIMILRVDQNITNSSLEPVSGASTKPTLVSWLPPGGYQRLSMWEIWCKNSQSFDVWRTLTPTGVKGCRNRVTCRSQVMRPQGPLMPWTPQMLSSKYCQR